MTQMWCKIAEMRLLNDESSLLLTLSPPPVALFFCHTLSMERHYPHFTIAMEVAAYFKGKGEKKKTKAQKLLYYSQGVHLKLFGEPLFDDEIEAWEFGPVVPPVWRAWDSFSF